MKIKKAVIPAAGYGTRRLPVTKVIPKEMFPIQSKPAIQYVVEEAISCGIEEILMIVSRNKHTIIDYFDRSLELEAFLQAQQKSHLLSKLTLPNVHIEYVRQQEAKGLGHALSLAKRFVQDEPFAVLLPDDLIISDQPALKALTDTYVEKQASVIGVMQVPKERLHQYGVVMSQPLQHKLHQINHLVEKPRSPISSNLAIVGRYVLQPTIFKHLDTVQPDPSGEIQLTDALKAFLTNNPLLANELTGKRFDIGLEEDYIQLIQLLHNS
ncbi:UTP--glucose-1-phosphate uridylyltransferase [Halalkalibacter sp. APA_J-10(15)]|uniref:UTP--glucose-1-phosphate uridylyltransferase n=1 Tax=Halalkalibacter sp. APA_J-10(15) TaxID=2933805 RepID=UPI001FF1AC80|nr:UTP--glucose-1-phosphate uridylyltransferase [Halalkalibacter sp. APA_J-10(15)]MCK0472909.1 UTP--glucose-1-phosphate uridylyltransferase [Halalkalibacter sp. APA_J-10(15)]